MKSRPNLHHMFLFTLYAMFLIESVSYFAIRYTPPAGEGVQGFNLIIIVMEICILIWFYLSRELKCLSKNLFHIPRRSIIFVPTYVVLSYYSTIGWSNAFLGIVVIYSVLIALIFEVYGLPMEPIGLTEMSEKQLELYATNWRFAIQLILTGSIASGVGLFYKGLTTDNFVPLHLIILLGLPALGIIYVILRLFQKVKTVQLYL